MSERRKPGEKPSREPVIDPKIDIADDGVRARKPKSTSTAKARARVLVVVPIAKQGHGGALRELATDAHSPENRRDEAIGLAQAIDLDVIDTMIIPLSNYRPSTLIGKGKVDELAHLVTEHEIDLVVIDHVLTPGQQSNLEKTWQTKVIDRTGLILEIFGARARTREGVLQVELAHLTYQKGRLVRAWTHLERQRGGSGFLGGPGEAQIELDRRMLQDRIDAIKRDLKDVVRTRVLHRQGRRKVPYPIVAIVGYTNAGKSTLFNRITGADVLAADQVFATLDPTMREVRLPSARKIILSDTVGFISDLPTMLIAAFRATLEEVIEADLILHVRDISHDESDAQASDVASVLKDLGIDTDAADCALLEVWNKIDRLSEERVQELQHSARRDDRKPVPVSAVTGEGIDALLDAIDMRLGRTDEILEVRIPGTAGALIAWLYETTDVLSRVTTDDGDLDIKLRLPSERKSRILARLQASGVIV